MTAVTRPPHGSARLPEVSRDEDVLASYAGDASHRQGRLLGVAAPQSEAEIAALLQSGARLLPVGARSSLTGGATGNVTGNVTGAGEVALSTRRFDRLELRGDLVRVGAGVTLHDLNVFLEERGRRYPAGPTWDGASVGGLVATNAAGPATFKYGPTRPWVAGLSVVLASGDVLDLTRGEVRARGRLFSLATSGGSLDLPVPAYDTLDLPKVAGGYFAREHMDLLDVFVGAEGTLGVVTEVTLRTVPLADTALVWLPLGDEAQALRLAGALREAARETWRTGDPLGLDVAAIESMDGRCLSLLREDGLTRLVPAGAGYALLMQLELPAGQGTPDALAAAFDEDAPDHPFTRLVRLLAERGALDAAQIALPGEPAAREFLQLRERVPEGVNRRVAEVGGHKVGGDPLVPFDWLGPWLEGLRASFGRAGLDLAVWGHLSDGNLHPNLIPHAPQDFETGADLIYAASLRALELGGAPLAEHGVGKHRGKQRLLRAMYGEAGLADMRRVKAALDPNGQLATGNIFAL